VLGISPTPVVRGECRVSTVTLTVTEVARCQGEVGGSL